MVGFCLLIVIILDNGIYNNPKKENNYGEINRQQPKPVKPTAT